MILRVTGTQKSRKALTKDVVTTKWKFPFFNKLKYQTPCLDNDKSRAVNYSDIY